jgi:hypothetical protein
MWNCTDRQVVVFFSLTTEEISKSHEDIGIYLMIELTADDEVFIRSPWPSPNFPRQRVLLNKPRPKGQEGGLAHISQLAQQFS